MMTKDSDKGLKVSRNGESEKKSEPSSTKGDLVGSGSSSTKLKSSPGKENNKNQTNLSSTGGESSDKNKKVISTEQQEPAEKREKNSEREEEGDNNKKISSSALNKDREGEEASSSAGETTSAGQQLQKVRSGSVASGRSPGSIDIGEPMGLPSEQLLVPNVQSTNGHDTASLKNGLKRQNSARQKCRCWCCCCCSCSGLALKNNEPKGKEAESDLICDPDPPPTLEEIRTWGESFDKLMHCSGGRKVFRDFLKCEYSEENILFWLACEELKKEKVPEVIEEKARLIYEDYISILSPKEVSLDSRVRDVVNQNMRNPRPSTFDEAQLQIYTLMHRDSYPRFVNSPLYKKLAQLTSSGNIPGAGSHRGSTISVTSPASRKQSAAS